MRTYRPSYTKAKPPDAQIKRDKGGKYCLIRDRQGISKKCRIKGERILIESSFYFIVFRDHNQIQQRLQAYRDKASSDQLSEKIGQLVYRVERGRGLSSELQEWSDSLPDVLHDQLSGFGLLKRRRKVIAGQGLDELLELFEQSLSVKKRRSPQHVGDTVGKVRRSFDACGFKVFQDIDDIALDKYLMGLREKKKLATRTLNGYVGALQQFCRYCVRVLKLSKMNPLDAMENFGSESADRRRQRRALTRTEVEMLLTTTEQGPVRFGMDGKERSLLYRFALMTGLRANEIRTLRVEHFDFEQPDGPVVLIEAAYSKHRERDIMPLHKTLAPRLKRFFKDQHKLPTAKAFGGDFRLLTDKTAIMIREDLEAAKVEYETISGVCDFHSLRHTFCSSLKSMATRQAQGLSRHKSSAMTDNYSHRSLAERQAALNEVDFFGIAG